MKDKQEPKKPTRIEYPHKFLNNDFNAYLCRIGYYDSECKDISFDKIISDYEWGNDKLTDEEKEYLRKSF